LSWEDVALAVTLDAGGKSQQEIATLLKVNQSSISKVLTKFKDTRQIAKIRLRASAELIASRILRATEVAAERGDAAAALEVLDRIDAVPKRQERQSGNRVMVVVGGMPAPDFNIQVLGESAQPVASLPAYPDDTSGPAE